MARPVVELLGFARVSLAPGARASVRFDLVAEQFAFTGVDYQRVVEPGRILLRAGTSAADLPFSAVLELRGPKVGIPRRTRFLTPGRGHSGAGLTRRNRGREPPSMARRRPAGPVRVPRLQSGRTPAAGVDAPMPTPRVPFTENRLANGLRLVLAEDHLAPVVAVNLWYSVGSKNEVPGKTGFAHLFEHVMFQGSRNVGKAEHIALVQAAGGTMNGTTWLDRTNYFETMPSHQLELALWLEADRMGTLLEALSQENLDNQREVVKNEKRWSYDNRPYGSWNEKLQAHLFPDTHPYHHPTIGSMEDLDAASVDDVSEFFRTWYAPNNAVLAIVGDFDAEQALGLGGALLRRHPGQPEHPDAAGHVPAAGARRRTSRDGARPRAAAARLLRVPGAAVRRHPPRRPRGCRTDPRRRQGLAPLSPPRPRRADRPGRRRVRARVHRRRVHRGGLGDGPTGRACRAGRRRSTRRSSSGSVGSSSPTTSWHGRGRSSRRRSWAPSSASRNEPTASRCTRPCSTIPTGSTCQLDRYLSVTAEQIRDVAALVFRADNRVVMTYVPIVGPPGAEDTPDAADINAGAADDVESAA